MTEHERVAELLPLYSARTLPEDKRQAVERHLQGCAACRADLKLWQMVGSEITASSARVTAPARLAEGAQARVRPLRALRRAGQLLQAQALLVQRELWPASAVVMALGVAVALLSRQQAVIYFLAPMLAAASLAVIYSPENDPCVELASATPTPASRILLARLTLVSGYNLLLALAASLVLLAGRPSQFFGTLVLAWFAPMTFLAALALVLSLWAGTANAVTVAYGLWVAQFLPFQANGAWALPSAWFSPFAAYQQFWHQPLALIVLAVFLLVLALWLVDHPLNKYSRT